MSDTKDGQVGDMTLEEGDVLCSECLYSVLGINDDPCSLCREGGRPEGDKSAQMWEPKSPPYPYPHVEPCWVCGSVEMEFREVEFPTLGAFFRALCPQCGAEWEALKTKAMAQGIRNRECAEKRGHGMVWTIESGIVPESRMHGKKKRRIDPGDKG